MNCTFEIIQEELKRGMYNGPLRFPLICSKGQELIVRITNGEAKWSELFEKNVFFSRYHYYLQIVASCDDEAIQKKW